jgi:hypothetical protein
MSSDLATRRRRDLVPTRHLVTGDVDFIDNVVAFRTLRGEFISRGREVTLSDGRIRTELVLLDRRVRLLARVRRRVLMVVWPTGERRLVRAFRVFSYVAGAAVAGVAVVLLVQAIESIITMVEFVIRYWEAFVGVLGLMVIVLVIASVRAGAGPAGKVVELVARFCHACGRAL